MQRTSRSPRGYLPLRSTFVAFSFLSAKMNRSFSRSVGTSSQQQNVPKYFDILPYPPLKVRVHPVVILTILDANLRREDGQMNVIGTLLGTVSEGNVVDISDCFVDRHSLTDEVRKSLLDSACGSWLTVTVFPPTRVSRHKTPTPANRAAQLLPICVHALISRGFFFLPFHSPLSSGGASGPRACLRADALKVVDAPPPRKLFVNGEARGGGCYAVSLRSMHAVPSFLSGCHAAPVFVMPTRCFSGWVWSPVSQWVFLHR